MSDEEEYDEAAEEEEENEEKKPKPPKPIPREDDGPAEMTEAEKAMMAAKQKHEQEEAVKLKEYEEQRGIQREREEEELRALKEKQERRKQEREEEDKLMADRRKQEEERRKQEEEERKQRMEDEKRKKEEKKKKAQLGLMGFGGSGSGPNFVIPQTTEKDEKFDKFGNIVKAKAEMGMTKEQMEEKKKQFLAEISKPLNVAGLDINGLREKIKSLHQRICKLEADKYDLEKRHERQEYDLKELNERQRQIARNKALQKGLDPDEASNSRHPPKVSVVSKYDRQIDRRNFRERRAIFESRRAIPHFPNCPPPEQPMEKVVLSDVEKKQDDEEEEEEEAE